VFTFAEVRRATGRYPIECIVVGYLFKKRRFLAHAKALGYTGRFEYLGINDPKTDIRPNSIIGEYLKLRSARDDSLLRGDQWRAQRAARNPLNRPLPDYTAVDPALAHFVDYAFGDGPMAPPPNW
jgi:hypothetical protein